MNSPSQPDIGFATVKFSQLCEGVMGFHVHNSLHAKIELTDNYERYRLAPLWRINYIQMELDRINPPQADTSTGGPSACGSIKRFRECIGLSGFVVFWSAKFFSGYIPGIDRGLQMRW